MVELCGQALNDRLSVSLTVFFLVNHTVMTLYLDCVGSLLSLRHSCAIAATQIHTLFLPSRFERGLDKQSIWKRIANV